ncbi:MAG: CBS domain-containing protein [Candidatus Methanoperedens sp.]|jgi:CBS domain-containing protein|nr:CBS domain-containing protein [Candidatus Methanoperedens sp.]PKL52823.1 MAG: CBS domain-containing protein [Candidatus Methanoperedenaceae archaeon HGW-Methanoperedenaceae-1]
MYVKDIMKKPFSANKADTISHAMDMMDKHNTRRLLVENGGELLGVITMRSIARKLGTWKTANLPASSLHVATATTDLFTKVLPDTNIKDAIVLMEKNDGILVITENSHVMGWVTPHEILENASLTSGYAAEVMEEPITVSPAERVSHARRLMMDNDLGRLPVIENDIVVGIVTERDIAKSMMSLRALVSNTQLDERIRNLIVGDIMTHGVIYVKTNTPLPEVISLILEKNIGGVPVLNLKDELVGIISRRTIIKHLAAKG